MKQRKFNTVSILLVVLLFYNSMGYYLASSAMLLIHREKTFSAIQSGGSQHFTDIEISREAFVRLDIHSFPVEIVLSGKKYDVAKAIDHGKFITLKCFHDAMEDRMAEHSQDASKHSSRSPWNSSQILDTIIKTALISSFNFHFSEEPVVLDFQHTELPLAEMFIPVPSLPPQA